jgi:hypothetical protein
LSSQVCLPRPPSFFVGPLCSMADYFEDCELYEFCTAREVQFTVGMLLNMDWVTRHDTFDNLAEIKPHNHMCAIAEKLGPDQFWYGRATGVPPPPVIIIVPLPSVIVG